MSQGFDLRGLDEMFYAECDGFLNDAEGVLRTMPSAAELPMVYEVLKRSVHSIKGAALTLGFTGLGALATALDAAVGAGRDRGASLDWALYREGVAALRRVLERIRRGADKTVAADTALIARLDQAALALGNGAAPRVASFRLSSVAASSPVIFDAMLNDLKQRVDVRLLLAPWESPERVCRLAYPASTHDAEVRASCEKVAEPGSLVIEQDKGVETSPTAEAPRVAAMTYCVAFRVGVRRFAADAPSVEEIRIFDRLHPSPSDSARIRGMLDVGDVFVPVIDVLDCLRLGSSEIQPSSMYLVTRAAGERVAVVVDEVDEVLAVAPALIQPLNALLTSGPATAGLLGVLRWHGDALWVLDLPALLEQSCGAGHVDRR